MQILHLHTFILTNNRCFWRAMTKDKDNAIADFWELRYYNENEKNEWLRNYHQHHTINGKTTYFLGNTRVCQGCFLWAHSSTNEKWNHAITSAFTGNAVCIVSTVKHDQLVAWLHCWVRNHTDRDPVTGHLHLHQWMSYQAIHAIYAEEMIQSGKPFLKIARFNDIRQTELPGLVHMRSTVLARYGNADSAFLI